MIDWLTLVAHTHVKRMFFHFGLFNLSLLFQQTEGGGGRRQTGAAEITKGQTIN